MKNQIFIDNNETRIVHVKDNDFRVETINNRRIQYFRNTYGWSGTVRNNLRLYIVKGKDLKSLHDDDQTKKGGV